MFLKPNPSALRAGHPLNRSLVGAWPTTEEGGSRLGDISAFRNNGALVNSPGWSGGKSGTALNFNGTNNYVDLGTPLILQPAQITVGVRIVPATLAGGTVIAYDKTQGQSWGIGVGATNTVAFYAADSGGAFTIAAAPSNSLVVGQLAHIVGTFDGVNLRTYINGVLAAILALPLGLVYNSSTKLIVGNYWNSGTPNDFYSGWIDDIRIYNRALSSFEVGKLYSTDFSEFRPLLRTLGFLGASAVVSRSNNAVTIIN